MGQRANVVTPRISPRFYAPVTARGAAMEDVLTLARHPPPPTMVLLGRYRAAMGKKGHHETHRWIDCFSIFLITLLFVGCPRVHADPSIELSGSAGFGVLTAGVTSGRFAMGASLRIDIFGPYLSEGLGIAVDCSGTWITGGAAVWSGVSVRCSAGPVLRFTSHR